MMFSSSQSTCHCFNRSLRLPTLLIAAVGIVVCPLAADAQDAPKNDVQVIDVGLKPDIFCSGAAVVPKTDNLYLTFHATKDGVNGLAVIQLENCLDRRFRAPGDDAYAWHPVDIEALSVCETYEVTNSSWAGIVWPTETAAKTQGCTITCSHSSGTCREFASGPRTLNV